MYWASIDKLNVDWWKQGIDVENRIAIAARTLFKYVGCRECKSLVKAWGEHRQLGGIEVANRYCWILKFGKLAKN